MKNVFKFGCLSVIGLILLGVIIGIATGGGSSSTSSDTKPKTETTAKQNKKVDPISRYNKIKIGDALTGKGGMTIKEVKAILGNQDSKTTSTSKIGNDETTMDVYTWINGFGKGITITFTNGLASEKIEINQ